MAVPVLHASSKLQRLVLLCGAGICLALAACNQNEGKNDRSDTGLKTSASPIVAPVSEDLGKVIVVKQIKGSPQATVSITYRANHNNDAACALQISEAGMVVAENREMIECGLLDSSAMVDVKLSGTIRDLTIFQQKAKQTNSYSLKRSGDGDWIVTRVEFIYPQDNADTGEIDVIRETADLIDVQPATLVSRFNRALIKDKLVKSVLQ